MAHQLRIEGRIETRELQNVRQQDLHGVDFSMFAAGPLRLHASGEEHTVLGRLRDFPQESKTLAIGKISLWLQTKCFDAS